MLVEIFCEIDDFCKFFEQKRLQVNSDHKPGRKPSLTPSEILTIEIYFHVSKFKTFKDYYKTLITGFLRSNFTATVSYNRFIELRQEYLFLLLLFAKIKGRGICDGISVMDSTTLEVCHIRRESSHKLFKGIATKGKSSTGWFYGFKLHLVINSKGEIVNFYITPGNVADNDQKVLDKLTIDVFGKLIADKGYIGAFKQLFEKGITLIHGIRKNMKNKLMLLTDKILLKKRGVIESVIGILKEGLGLEYSKHRSRIAYFVQVCSAIVAYYFKPNKPSLFSTEISAKLVMN